MSSTTAKEIFAATFGTIEGKRSSSVAALDRSRVEQVTQTVARIALTFALAFSVTDWFSGIRSPLWLDETNSYWSISQGFGKIWAHQGLAFPIYTYVLWFTKTLFGSSEVVLRLPSVFAMISAAYVLYCIARRFFEWDVAGIVTVIFCVHPFVSFAAIDARPYAFATLAVNCSILALLRWMERNTTARATTFGIALGSVFYFHYLFSVILGALAIVFVVFKRREWNSYQRNFAISMLPFGVMMLPVIPRVLWIAQTTQSHVYLGLPRPADLFITVVPGNVGSVFVGAVFIAVIVGKLGAPEHEHRATIPACLVLGLVPLLSLYAVSLYTPVHIFAERYRLVALPGVALCWGLLVSRLNSRVVRTIFCLALIAFTFNEFPGKTWKSHGFSWKDALNVADASAATTHAPLLICSGLRESSFRPMPTTDIAQSDLFAPLSYYKVHAPVVPLPRDFNQETKRQVTSFLATAIPNRERFLVVGHTESEQTTKWITSETATSYRTRELGTYDGMTVTEFVPR
ncbi:MAG TPA: glycosyltransferase family 39 protein [Terriglobales bacterium]|nr:glycosyltransferase family 39 protein [Terriglobales bacterium]